MDSQTFVPSADPQHYVPSADPQHSVPSADPQHSVPFADLQKSISFEDLKIPLPLRYLHEYHIQVGGTIYFRYVNFMGSLCWLPVYHN